MAMSTNAQRTHLGIIDDTACKRNGSHSIFLGWFCLYGDWISVHSSAIIIPNSVVPEMAYSRYVHGTMFTIVSTKLCVFAFMLDCMYTGNERDGIAVWMTWSSSFLFCVFFGLYTEWVERESRLILSQIPRLSGDHGDNKNSLLISSSMLVDRWNKGLKSVQDAMSQPRN